MRHKPMVFAPYAQPLSPDEPNVIRCWSADDLSGLSAAVSAHAVDTLMIQFNYSLFHFDLLDSFIQEQVEAGRTLFITLHATIDDLPADKKLFALIPALHRCRTLFVHTLSDLNRLKSHGLIGNVTLFPHGVVDYPFERNRTRNTIFTLATYGFFLPHKGLIETIHAVAILREEGMDIRLEMVNALYPAPISQQLIIQARDLIDRLGLESIVTLHTEFLPENVSFSYLEKADLILFPYQTTTESSSAAVRYGLASGVPVAVTPLPIFDDVREAVFTLSGTSPAQIAAGIAELSRIPDGQHSHITAENADRWRKAHFYSVVSRRLELLLKR
jgi:glycosyltransferase involved in cell wall biosynthesis